MFLIIATSISVALLVTRGLLSLGWTEMWIRYAISLLCAYATFFVGVWIWLHLSEYGRHLRARQSRSSLETGPDLGGMPQFSTSGTPDTMPRFSGGGGSFDGGGAAGGWEQPLSPPNLNIPYDSSGGSFSNINLPDVGVADVGGDEGGCANVIAGVLLAALLCVVFGAAAYVVYQAPAILAEVVFEVLLGSPLAVGMRSLDSASWAWALFRRTWLPFVIVTFMAMSFALFCNEYLPEAKSASDVVHKLWR